MQNAFHRILHFPLQIVRILYRLFSGLLHQTGIAAEGICYDFLFWILHDITLLSFPQETEMMIAF